jgi:hypothetical protein
VQFELRSVAKIAKFFDFVCPSFDCFTVSHRESLRSGLLLLVSSIIPNRLCSKPASNFPDGSYRLDRIISPLTSKFGGNSDYRVIFTVITNRVVNENLGNGAKNAPDIGTDSYFCSASEPNQSISKPDDHANSLLALYAQPWFEEPAAEELAV